MPSQITLILHHKKPKNEFFLKALYVMKFFYFSTLDGMLITEDPVFTQVPMNGPELNHMRKRKNGSMDFMQIWIWKKIPRSKYLPHWDTAKFFLWKKSFLKKPEIDSLCSDKIKKMNHKWLHNIDSFFIKKLDFRYIFVTCAQSLVIRLRLNLIDQWKWRLW